MKSMDFVLPLKMVIPFLAVSLQQNDSYILTHM